MIKRIAIDVQHIGKPHKPLDRGATYKSQHEAVLVLKYATALFNLLTQKGFEPFLLTHGSYASRHNWCNQQHMDLYLACHLNAGGGRYSLVEYTKPAEAVLAKAMLGTFNALLGTKSNWKQLNKDDRGYVCIEGLDCPALLLEPLFMDNDTHLDIAINCSLTIAECIVMAIEEVNHETNDNI